MVVMKGLNCYASFCDDPGIEKLLSIAQVKRSFLLPVTPSHVQRESLTLHLAAGKTKGPLTLQFSYWPAAAIFSLATYGPHNKAIFLSCNWQAGTSATRATLFRRRGRSTKTAIAMTWKSGKTACRRRRERGQRYTR